MSFPSSRKPFINGVKSSTKSNQLITSTGIPAIDILLGGGLPVGTVCVFEEDEHGVYSKYFVDCFAAEGVVCNHSLFVAGPSCSTRVFYEKLPALVISEVSDGCLPGSSSSDDLDRDTAIAWRYKNLSTVESSVDSSLKQAHSFSRNKIIEKDFLKNCALHVCDLSLSNCNWLHVNNGLTNLLCNDTFISSTSPGTKNLLRIMLPNCGSPLWGSLDKILQFLYNLKCLVRNRLAIAVITIPRDLFPELKMVRIRHYSDAFFRLESFESSSREKNPLFKNYKGLLHILKLPTLNSLNFAIPDCLDLAFKWKGEKLIIEKLHVPPELGEVEANIIAKQPGLSCASNFSSSKLDF